MSQKNSGSFTMSSGRVVSLCSLKMVRTYEGLMEGTPETATPHIRKCALRNKLYEFRSNGVVPFTVEVVGCNSDIGELFVAYDLSSGIFSRVHLAPDR